MNSAYPHVFEPISIRGVDYKNRLEVAPTSPGYAGETGLMTSEYVDFFRPIARGGAAIVTIGNSPIDFSESKDEARHLRLDIDEVMQPLSEFTEMVHGFNAVASIEVNHAGFDAAYEYIGKPPIGPCEIITPAELQRAKANGRKPMRSIPMSYEKVRETIQKYIDAAYRCKQAGFNMIMLHGGHANLIGQFSSPLFNWRTDEYGGTLEKRARFALEILSGIREKCGEDFVIEMRISADEMHPDGMHLEETKEYVKLLSGFVDIFNVSRSIRASFDLMRYWLMPYTMPHMDIVKYAAELRKVLPTTNKITCVGAVMNIKNAESILSNGYADFVAMARPYYADPEMPRKYSTNREDTHRPCVRCNYCTLGARMPRRSHCAVNPFLGRAREFPDDKVRKADTKKRVAVVGGGPAGMEAAFVLFERGHDVTLYEQREHLGGNLKYAAASFIKEDIKTYLDYLVRRTNKIPINLKIGTKVTKELLESEGYDGLVIAIGAEAIIPQNVPGIDGAHVHWAPLYDSGEVQVGNNIIVVGMGAVGAECALSLARDGKTVKVIDMVPDLTPLLGSVRTSFPYFMEEFNKFGVKLLPGKKLLEITEKEVRAIDTKTLEIVAYECDNVLLAMGLKPKKQEADELRRSMLGTDTFIVGDCMRLDNLPGAIQNAFSVTAYM